MNPEIFEFIPTEENKRLVKLLTLEEHSSLTKLLSNIGLPTKLILSLIGCRSKTNPGTPEFIPTEEQRKLTRQLSAIGLKSEQIARLIGCGKTTLFDKLHEELKLGAAEATATIAKTLFNKAKDGDNACMMFWLKCRANWSERAERQLGDIDGDPVYENIPTSELEKLLSGEGIIESKKSARKPSRIH